MSYGLQELSDIYGHDDPWDLIDECAYDSVVPAICTECGSTAEYEPDSTRGWCADCGENTVVSALILAGVI